MYKGPAKGCVKGAPPRGYEGGALQTPRPRSLRSLIRKNLKLRVQRTIDVYFILISFGVKCFERYYMYHAWWKMYNYQ